MIEKNVGQTERMIRGAVGIIGIILFFVLTGWVQWLALIVGLVLLATAALGWCPPYTLLGINTARRQ